MYGRVPACISGAVTLLTSKRHTPPLLPYSWDCGQQNMSIPLPKGGGGEQGEEEGAHPEGRGTQKEDDSIEAGAHDS